MANISDPFALDPASGTGNSNSNFAGASFVEGMAPSNVNNGVRALAAMLAQATSYKSASISASLSTNIAATGTGNFMSIIGVGPINSFGVVAGQHPEAAAVRLLHFATSTSISHGASIILAGNVSRKTEVNEVIGVVHDHTSSDVWREWTNPFQATQSITTLTVGSMSASMGRFSHMAAQSSSVSAATYTSISASVGSFSKIQIGTNPVIGAHYIIAHQAVSGTGGGSSGAAGAFRTVTLNTEILDQITITTAANVMALPAGTYLVDWQCPASNVDNFQTRLRDTTNAATLVTGTVGDAPSGVGAGFSFGSGSFTLAGAANVELQRQVTTQNLVDGGGQACSFGTEVYAQLHLIKVS